MKDFKVKIPGLDFELHSNRVYHIREVSDKRAPDGYQKAGISYHPLPNIAKSIIVPFHEPTMSWNTGFFKNSACYNKVTEEERDVTLKTLNENLISELKYLVEGDLTHGRSTNNELFDSFPPFNPKYGADVSTYKIKNGNMFNTKNPLEFLALWWSLLSGLIKPESYKDSSYTSTNYLLEDKKVTTSIEQDNEFVKATAVATVLADVRDKSNKESLNYLQLVLEYVGLDIDLEQTNQKPIISMFSNWCEKRGYNNENATYFIEVYDKFKEGDKKDELVIFSNLKKHIKSSKIKLERTEIILDGVNLGSDKKEAASKIFKDQELFKTFMLL